MSSSSRIKCRLWAAGLLAACAMHAGAQPASGGQLPALTVNAASSPDPVEKSYRRMIRGLDLFEAQRAAVAPGATLRFRLLPRHRETDMRQVDVAVIGTRVDFAVPVAPDHTFTLQRNQQAFEEDAQVVSDRKALTMTWRAEVRSPGVPEGMRRLGDLRLECRVGMAAGLVSNRPSLLDRIGAAFVETPAYCDRPDPQYLFFADRPVFSVALVSGARREVMPAAMLHAGISTTPRVTAQLPFCDCEVLVDRTYVLPLGDRSWPDDALVQFEYIDDPVSPDGTDAVGAVLPGKTSSAQVASALGPAAAVRLDSGHEVWVYQGRQPAPGVAPAEFVLLFGPSGIVQKVRLRPAYGPPGAAGGG